MPTNEGSFWCWIDDVEERSFAICMRATNGEEARAELMAKFFKPHSANRFFGTAVLVGCLFAAVAGGRGGDAILVPSPGPPPAICETIPPAENEAAEVAAHASLQTALTFLQVDDIRGAHATAASIALACRAQDLVLAIRGADREGGQLSDYTAALVRVEGIPAELYVWAARWLFHAHSLREDSALNVVIDSMRLVGMRAPPEVSALNDELIAWSLARARNAPLFSPKIWQDQPFRLAALRNVLSTLSAGLQAYGDLSLLPGMERVFTAWQDTLEAHHRVDQPSAIVIREFEADLIRYRAMAAAGQGSPVQPALAYSPRPKLEPGR